MDEKKVRFALEALRFCYLARKYQQRKKQKKSRRWWVRPTYQKRKREGFFEKTFKYIKENDEELFFNATRMNMAQYNLLLNLLKGYLTKTSIRKPIEPECRLAVALMYLSQGVSITYLALTFRMGRSTIRSIIVEICTLLWQLLSPIYMSKSIAADWKKISDDFDDKWQMPNCLGSIDGKHVEIKCPPKSGSRFYNYKGYFSIVLLAVCDANYVFTAVDVGAYGSQSDGGILKNSKFGQKILTDDINLPPPSKLPNSNKIMPYYFVGDNAFPLKENNLMRPYPGLLPPKDQQIFNYRLCRARRVIENTFGILCSRWRVLNNRIDFSPKNADYIVLACVILHNFLKITDGIYSINTYCPANYCDTYGADDTIVEGLWRQQNVRIESLGGTCAKNSTKNAFAARRLLTEYFVNEGRVSFQPQ